MERNRKIKETLWNDPILVRILHMTRKHARTPNDISKSTGISIRECYQKLNILNSMGLLGVDMELVAPNGAMVRYYKATLDDTYITFDGGRTKIRLESCLSCI